MVGLNSDCFWECLGEWVWNWVLTLQMWGICSNSGVRPLVFKRHRKPSPRFDRLAAPSLFPKSNLPSQQCSRLSGLPVRYLTHTHGTHTHTEHIGVELLHSLEAFYCRAPQTPPTSVHRHPPAWSLLFTRLLLLCRCVDIFDLQMYLNDDTKDSNHPSLFISRPDSVLTHVSETGARRSPGFTYGAIFQTENQLQHLINEILDVLPKLVPFLVFWE